ncbi:MAG: hypothetical protein HQ581_26150 [Planctomycetes bacterium]|nr:hypothetical protein [Planctomycetota bacterium]
MQSPNYRCFALSALLFLLCISPGLAAGRVNLLVVTEPRTAPGEQQSWMRRLSRAGITSVRLRTRQPLDRVGIQVIGSGDRPTYAVTGSLNSRGELELPGRRFRAGQESQIAQFLDDLAEHGPPTPAEGKPPADTAPFGLTSEQFELARTDMSTAVRQKTAGVDRHAALEAVRRQLALSLRVDAAAVAALRGDTVAEELSGMSCGTALACLLRPAGLCLVVRQGTGALPEYVVVPARPNLEIWPIGWKSEKVRRQLIPNIFAKLNANIQRTPVINVIKAICGRLNVPYLLDHNALARWGIDVNTTLVTLPPGEKTYEQILKKALYDSKLKCELRVDEAEKPFFWITSFKPM